MAKIHKGIATGSGFAYKGKDLNFSRDVYDNFADLKYDASTYGFPDGFKTVVIDPADSQITREKYTTFIYANSKWKVASNVKLFDNVISDPMTEGISFTGITGITGIDLLKGGKNVWDTNGGVVNLTEVENSVKSYVADNYTNTSTLNETLKSYAKLASANFTELKVGDKTVATQDWTTTTVDKAVATATSQALKYKNGIAQQTDIPTTGVEVGWVYVCTTEGDYTINGGTVHLEVGDTLICKSTTVSEMWTIVQANITGAVTKSGNLASGQLVVGTGLSSVKALDAGANGKFLKVEDNVLTWGDVPLFNGKRNGLVQLPAEDVRTGSFLSMDGTWKIPHDTTYDDATITTHGLMTAADKVKLNGIEAGANKYSHPATHPATMITGLANVATSGSYSDLSNKPGTMNGASASASGTSGFVPVPAMGQQGLFLRGDGNWAKPTDTLYTLKAATADNLGGIKIGYMSDVINKKYAVELDNEKAFVTVPWTDTTYGKFKPATDGLVPAPGADNTTKFLRGDGSWAIPTDTVYTAGTGISIDNKVIKNTGIRTLNVDLAEGSNDTIEVNINGSANKIIITDVANAYNAVKVTNALTIKSYNDDGSSIDTVTYDGSVAGRTIECIAVEDINKLFLNS